MKRLLAILLLMSMLLAACVPVTDAPDTTGDPSQSTGDPNQSTDDPTGTNDPNVQEVTVRSRDGFSTTIQIVSGQIIFNDAIFEYFSAGNMGALEFECKIKGHYSLERIPLCDLYLLLCCEGFNAFLVDTKTKEILDPLASMGEGVQGYFSGMCVSPDGKYALVDYRSGTVLELLELETGNRTKMPYEEGLYGVNGRFLDNKIVLITSIYQEAKDKFSYRLSRYDISTGENTELEGRMTMTGGPFAHTFTEEKLTLIDLRTMERTVFPLDIKEVTAVSHNTMDSVCVRVGTTQYILKMDGSMQLVNSMEEFDALFGDMNSWYNRALTSQYVNPTQVNLELLFYNGFPDESSKPTDAEWEELQNKPGFDIHYDLERLPAEKMNQILSQYLGITLADVETTGFYGLVYLESTNCYYRMGTDAEVVDNFKATAVEALANGTVRLCYTSGYENTAYVAMLKPTGNGYQILSNLRADNNGEDPRLATFDSLFGNTDYWYNKALTSLYTDPSKVSLKWMFYCGFPGEKEWAINEEEQTIDIPYQFLMRLPVDKLNTVLTQLFGINLEDMDVSAFKGLVYLDSTSCYYHSIPNTSEEENAKNFNATRVESLEDGTVRVYYTAYSLATGYDKTEECVAVLKLVNGQWQILANLRADNTTGDPRINMFEDMFGELSSWHNMALCSRYAEPSKVILRQLFYGGFPDESREPTDAEQEELKGKLSLEWDGRQLPLIRLPIDKMNQVLTEYFGITLEEMDASAFEGLVYLENTKCYYLASYAYYDGVGYSGFRPVRVEDMAEGTVRLYYKSGVQILEECVVLKQVDGRWQILSNLEADGVKKDLQLEDCDEMFGDINSWYNKALSSFYADPPLIDLKMLFYNGFPNEPKKPTNTEREELEGRLGIDLDLNLIRVPFRNINQVLYRYLNIDLSAMHDSGLEGAVRLSNMACYYFTVGDTEAVEKFKANRLEHMADGTVRVYYTARSRATDYKEAACVVTLKWVDGRWKIASNLQENGIVEDPRLAEFDKLFRDMNNWYNKGLTDFFADSSEINLKMLFYRGFSDESGKLTDAEKEALQGKVNLELDVRRLPVKKMNEVLSRYFNVSIEGLQSSSFEGLVYLESTDCYYFSAGDTEVVENFKAIRVESLEYGKLRMYYTARSRATDYQEVTCVAVVRPMAGRWQILSNQRA